MKDNIKVYSLEDAQTQKPLQPEKASESRVEEHSHNAFETNSEGVSEETYKRLHSNPFYVKGNPSSSSINSIEDFYIDVKKTTMPLGVVLRGGQFKPGKRKKLVKKALKKWKIGFLDLKDRLVFEGEQAPTVGNFLSQTLGVMHYILPALIIVLISFLVYFSGHLWTGFVGKSWFTKVLAANATAINTKWFVSLSKAVIYLAVAAILYVSLYNLVLGDLKKMDKTRKKLMAHTTVAMDKEFKKKYKVTSRYYLRRAGRRKVNYSPLPIDKTMLKKVDLQEIEDLTANFVKKASKVKKKKFTLNALKFLLVYFTYLGGIGVIGYYLYLVVMNFF